MTLRNAVALCGADFRRSVTQLSVALEQRGRSGYRTLWRNSADASEAVSYTRTIASSPFLR